MAQNKTHQSQEQQVKLLHGQFFVYDRFPENVTVERLVNPLTQEELADGWKMVLPRPSKNRPVHHYSISLSYLPEHLWKYLKLYTNADGVTQYRVLKDKVYHYSVKHTPYDYLLLNLYKAVTNKTTNHKRIRDLLNYTDLQNYKHNGWLMIRARKMVS